MGSKKKPKNLAGKVGGISCEQLKVAVGRSLSAPCAPKGALHQLHLVDSPIFGFLVPDVIPDHTFVSTHC